MSACDTCPQPGRCCTDFAIYSQRIGGTRLEAIVFMASQQYADPNNNWRLLSLPFMPSHKGTDDAWRWRCVDLQPDGRCGNYENRPYGPCVMFEAKSDPLCVLYEKPAEDLTQGDVLNKPEPKDLRERADGENG